MPHDTGDSIPAHGCVSMVTVVGDLRSQFIVITCPTGVHNVTRVKTGLSWFFCGEWREFVLLDKNKTVMDSSAKFIVSHITTEHCTTDSLVVQGKGNVLIYFSCGGIYGKFAIFSIL